MAKKNIIKSIISSQLVQTFLIYVSGGWITLELSDYLINKYGLNEKVSDVLPIILLIGLPIAIFLAWYLSKEREESKKRLIDKDSGKKSQGIFIMLGKKPWFFTPGILVLLLLILTGVRSVYHQVKIKWAREQAIPQMQNLASEYNFVKAFNLRQQVKRYIPDDPEFLKLDKIITKSFNIITDPEGADVYYKEYSEVNEDWNHLGTTPLVNLEMPDLTLYRWKLEKQGYDVVYAAARTNLDSLTLTLHITGTIPEGMVYVEDLYPQTVSNFLSPKKNGFYIDKYEVTNQMFKEFIDHGGYQNPDFWQNEFILYDDTLTLA